LLQLLEERHPGTLDSAEPDSYGKLTAIGPSPSLSSKDNVTPQTMARSAETKKQAAVDADSQGQEGSGFFNVVTNSEKAVKLP